MRSRISLAMLAFALGTTAFVPAADADLFSGSGYPGKGRAIDTVKPAADYTDALQGRPRALGIMRARAQGFVPSPELHDYVKSVLMRDLAGISLPQTFHPDVKILAAPEFAALCTPDGTIIVTVGLLEMIENEDELAFVLGHEVSHAIYRHHDSDWFKKSQYYMVVNGAAVDDVARHVSFSIGGVSTSDIARGADFASHVAKLSGNVLVPQYERQQEDMADALGFDLMVRAGYDPEAAFSLIDKLGQQEAEAEQAAQSAKAAAEKKSSHDDDDDSGSSGVLGALGGLSGGFGLGGGGGVSRIGAWAGLAMDVFDTAVDSMSTEAASHHPAKEREELLANYEFREYRDIVPVAPRPLAWSPDSASPQRGQLTALLAHYSDAENAAAYIADASQGTPQKAQSDVQRATGVPTSDHAYTQFVASEYYDKDNQKAQSEAALEKAAAGPEPSWEVYSRLADIYIARNDWPRAQGLMDQAVVRFDNSPVLLPKRIEILHGAGRQADADRLLPQCDSYDIHELYAECKKAASG
jgi:Zn-dependent protease with chaperone function